MTVKVVIEYLFDNVESLDELKAEILDEGIAAMDFYNERILDVSEVEKSTEF
jgi:hypothetical protein